MTVPTPRSIRSPVLQGPSGTRLAAFVAQLQTADAVTVDSGPVLTSWVTEIPPDLHDLESDDSFVRFNWVDEEGLEYDEEISPRSFETANRPQMIETGRWKLVDTQGDETEICLFKLIPLHKAPQI